MSRLALLPRRLLSSLSARPPLASPPKAPRMSQVEVDEPHVQQQLGKMQMSFVKKAEKLNMDRAVRHRYFRRGDVIIASKNMKYEIENAGCVIKVVL